LLEGWNTLAPKNFNRVVPGEASGHRPRLPSTASGGPVPAHLVLLDAALFRQPDQRGAD
jgi:hypothetical protein